MDFYTRLNDEALHAKWRDANEKMKELCKDDEILCRPSGSLKYERGLDKAVIPMLNVLNLIPGVSTWSSCEGHGRGDFFILVRCNSMPALHFLIDTFKKQMWVTKDDGSKFIFADWIIEIFNIGSIILRAFENVEFRIYSTLMGEEFNDKERMELSMKWARVISDSLAKYCSDWDGYDEKNRKEKETLLEMEMALPESEEGIDPVTSAIQ